MEKVLGIDLGTSNSCVAVMHNQNAFVIPDANGVKIHPSIVHFGQDGRILVGVEAKPKLSSHPNQTVYASKRLIGRKYFSAEVKKAKAIMPYKIIEGSEHSVLLEINGQAYTLQEVSAAILKKMKYIAESYFGETFRKAVVTVPAYFNDNQRSATIDAGRIAGLDIIRIINEPTAAALAYGYGKNEQKTVAVYDLGGGTFDISILELGDGVFEVISSAGDTYLGGEDFDDRIIDWITDEYVRKYDYDPGQDPILYQDLRSQAEQARIALNDSSSVVIRLDPPITSDATAKFEMTFDQNQLKELVHDLMQKTFQVCDEAFSHAGIRNSDINGLILVGGPTRMPLLQEYTQAYFQLTPQSNIDPDQVVAVGAAIQGDILTGGQKDVVLVDLTPLSLGIEIRGGLLHRIVEINTPLPLDHTEHFTTNVDNQKSVRISVYQGESKTATQNELLGEFLLDNLPRGLAGEVSVDVNFEIDTNGILNVTAINTDTGAKESIQLIAAGRLEKERVQELSNASQFDFQT
ncbi:MAG: Hsp70 family protein [Deltaproteobacteria bacterium]|nr:Hsp70 family protein [Deltaproteobacteria bacterium]